MVCANEYKIKSVIFHKTHPHHIPSGGCVKCLRPVSWTSSELATEKNQNAPDGA